MSFSHVIQTLSERAQDIIQSRNRPLLCCKFLKAIWVLITMIHGVPRLYNYKFLNKALRNYLIHILTLVLYLVSHLPFYKQVSKQTCKNITCWVYSWAISKAWGSHGHMWRWSLRVMVGWGIHLVMGMRLAPLWGWSRATTKIRKHHADLTYILLYNDQYFKLKYYFTTCHQQAVYKCYL